MTQEQEDFSRFVQVARQVYMGGQLLRAWKLTGGGSAQVNALEIRLPDSSAKKVVVRQHQGPNLINDPKVAILEFKVLQMLKAGGAAVPAPLYLDSSGGIFPIPYLVIDFVDGQEDFSPSNLESYLTQAATTLTAIHSVSLKGYDLDFLRNLTKREGEILTNPPTIMDESLQEPLIRSKLEKNWPPPKPNPAVLLHWDYWPGNLLWQGEKLAAVIDWEDAILGDPMADLGNSRQEFLWFFGAEAMETFTAIYKEQLPGLDYSGLPYWDLAAALRPAGKIAIWAGDPEREKVMRERHHLFVAQAFEKLGQA